MYTIMSEHMNVLISISVLCRTDAMSEGGVVSRRVPRRCASDEAGVNLRSADWRLSLPLSDWSSYSAHSTETAPAEGHTIATTLHALAVVVLVHQKKGTDSAFAW